MSKNKILQILEGWTNNLIKKEEVEEYALPRLEICSECPEMSTYPEEVKMISYCKACNCQIQSKVRSSQAECPLSKWKAQP